MTTLAEEGGTPAENGACRAHAHRAANRSARIVNKAKLAGVFYYNVLWQSSHTPKLLFGNLTGCVLSRNWSCPIRLFVSFLLRDAMHSAVRGKISVCLSVSHAGILSKRLNVYTELFHYRIATPFCYFHTFFDE